MSDQSKLGLGQIITTNQERDAIHIAVAPVVAGEYLTPGSNVQLENGKAIGCSRLTRIGVVDPFLDKPVIEGDRFWLFLNPGSITSLRHQWSHPAFDEATGPIARSLEASQKSDSEKWMRTWAREHMGRDYYGNYDGYLTEDQAYENAIQAGHNMNVGPYEDARDWIDETWWRHWETITGETGQRGEYFSCSC